MYVTPNFKTKKALKEALAKKVLVRVYNPGPIGTPVTNGTEVVEGPHFPEPHRWYAEVLVQNGFVVKVLS